METHTDRHALTELSLYIHNDYGAYRAYFLPACRTIARHYDRGRGDYEKGIKALARYAVLPAARQYLLEHGSMTEGVRSVFPPAIRQLIATDLMDYFLSEYRLGNRFWEV